MLDYKQSKIYTITNENNIYIGSTTLQLQYRFCVHQTQKTCSMYQYIQEKYHGNWDEWKINLYEEYACNSKKELLRKEGEVIRYFKNLNHYNIINKRIEGRTHKEWIEDNKENYTEYKKQYSNNRKEIRKQYDKDNKEKIDETRKIYYKNNIEKIKEKSREKIECDCGYILTRKCLKRHQNRQLHKDLMNKQTTAILSFLECF